MKLYTFEALCKIIANCKSENEMMLVFEYVMTNYKHYLRQYGNFFLLKLQETAA